MSRGLSNNMGPESHLSDEKSNKLDHNELFAVLDVKDIIAGAYRKVTLEEYVGAQHHMNDDRQTKFKAVLKKHKILFNGRLGLYPHERSPS